MKRGIRESVFLASKSCSESRAEGSCKGTLENAKHLLHKKSLYVFAFAAQCK